MKHPVLLAILVLISFIILVTLGTWQVKRLYWKEAMIDRIHSRTNEKPIPLQAAIDRFYKKGDVEYLPVRLQGRFRHETEKHLYTLDEKGRPGWHIYSVMEVKGSDCAACLSRNRFVYVNRGFVPLDMKNADRRRDGLVAGKVELIGLVRVPRENKRAFEAGNQPRKNEWYWPSLKEMSTPDAGLGDAMVVHLAPLFVEEGASNKSYDWPRPGVTRVKLSNRHLEYVITWYGLALALLAVYGFLLYDGWRKRNSGNGDSR